MSAVRRLASSAIRLVVRAGETLMGLAGRHAVAAVTTIAAAAGAFLASAPWGSILGLPFGVVAREIERARTSDLRARAIATVASQAHGALDARLRIPALQPAFVRYDEPPRMRDFVDVDDAGRAGGTFHLGRDGYHLEEQLRALSLGVTAATGGSAPHLSTRSQRALTRFTDALAGASEAAGAMTLAEAERSYALMASEGHPVDEAAGERAQHQRAVEANRLRQSIREAIAAEAELAR